MPDPTPEIWLPIAGYEGMYQVSSLGRVLSLERTVPHRYSGTHWVRERILKPTPVPPYGYLRVTLSDNESQRRRYVHQLVCEAFHGPRPLGHEVCHGPGGKLDNRAVNLSWGTPSENQMDKLRDGTHHLANRTHCPRGHPLVAPNLHPATAKRGARCCLACNRAMSYVRHARNRHGIILDLQETSDRYYADIMLAAA